MRVSTWVVLFVAAMPAWAKLDVATCGTHRDRAKEELFLHGRSMERRSALRLASAPAAAIPDAGDIAIIDDSSGAVARRNPFTLERRTIVFTPAGAGYTFRVSGDTYDRGLADAGAPVALSDDDSRELALPFAFPYYGGSFTSLHVNSDGNLTFEEADTATSERSLGRLTAGPGRIAPLFQDLDPSRSGSVRVSSSGSVVAVSWVEVPDFANLFARVTFQIRLYPDGRIEFAYGIVTTSGAVTGISPGRLRGAAAVLAFVNGSNEQFLSTIAERFGSTEEVDLASVAQRFYETHGDAYDYLVVYNALGIPASAGAVAYESTTRNDRTGYGDPAVDIGRQFGSASRLQAMLNLGPTTQYPLDPNEVVPARRLSRDTPLTVLAHEAGHLFLAFASVREGTARPMLGFQSAHWGFTFNSEASMLEGNRIEDRGIASVPRFKTVAVTEQFSPLDQYLMGLRAPQDVPPTFYVSGASIGTTFRTPQIGVEFDGNRRDVTVDDLIAAEGRRTPDHTVAQRRYRFAFILVVPSAGAPPAAEIAQIDTYRREFEGLFSRATGDRATADTRLRRAVQLSAHPAAGVIVGGTGKATLTIEQPAAADLAFTLRTAGGAITTPASVTIRAGAASAEFAISGVRAGVDDLTAEPGDSRYDSAAARVAVSGAAAGLSLELVSGDKQVAIAGLPLAQPVVVRVRDVNRVPYAGVRIESDAAGTATTDERGEARFPWTPPGPNAQLRISLGAASVTAAVGAVRSMSPAVNAASFSTNVAPGSLASVFGTNLTFPARSAAGPFPWPESLAGVELRVGGQRAQLLYVSPAQVNFLMPANVAPGTANLTLTADGVSVTNTATVGAVAPGIFYDTASGYGAILLAGTATTTQQQAVAAGQIVEVYATGIGGDVTATIGNQAARVLYAGLAPGFVGLNQINVEIPQGLAAGTQPLIVRSGAVASNSVLVGVR